MIHREIKNVQVKYIGVLFHYNNTFHNIYQSNKYYGFLKIVLFHSTSVLCATCVQMPMKYAFACTTCVRPTRTRHNSCCVGACLEFLQNLPITTCKSKDCTICAF